MFYDKLRVTVGGDAAGGFLVDIHDGENNAVYSPEGVGNTDEAVAAALTDHGKGFPKAPTENDYVPQENGYPAEDQGLQAKAADQADVQNGNGSQTKPAEDAETAQPAAAEAEAAPKAEEGAAPAASEANSQSAEHPQA